MAEGAGKEGMKQHKEKYGASVGQESIIRDPRFARLHSDPRFQRVAKNKVRIPIDSRFQRMFWDKNFLDPSAVDKRGKRTKKKDRHLLNRYYRVEDDQLPAGVQSGKEQEDSGGAFGGNAKQKSVLAEAKEDVHHDQAEEEYEMAFEGKEKKKSGLATASKDGIDGKRRKGSVHGKRKSDGSSQSEEKMNEKIKMKKGLVKRDGSSKLGLAKAKSLARVANTDLRKRDNEKHEEHRKDYAVKKEKGDTKLKGIKKFQGKKTVVQASVSSSGEESDAEARVARLDEESDVEARVASSAEENGLEDLHEYSGERTVAQPSEVDDEEDEESVEDHADIPRHSLAIGAGSGAIIGHNNSVLKGRYSDSESTSSSEEMDASQSDSSSTSEEDVEALEEDESDHDEDKVATTENETKRLALVNMDWDHIKAVDLLMLMKSFLPKGGHVESVAIYPSQFGLEQMKNEEQHGPQGVFEPDDERDSDEENEIDMEKLRNYEKSKLRYYFAVVTCDSAVTASSLYAACDGMEFERTSNVLDMRFIPDDMIFEAAPRDTASEVPSEYKVPEFETRALQHSNVKLTWDDEEPVRVKALRQKFNADQLNEMDFKDYLASEDDSESDHISGCEIAAEKDEDTSQPGASHRSSVSRRKLQTETYRSLLLDSEGNSKSKKSDKSDVDMEITFHSGLSDLSKRLLQQQKSKGREDETVWEAYLRKKKEKKKAKKKELLLDTVEEKSTAEQSDEASEGEGDDFFQHEEEAFDDPFFNSDEENVQSASRAESLASKPTTKKVTTATGRSHNNVGDPDRERRRKELQKNREEEEKSKAELELLLMDDHSLQSGVKGFNLKAKKLKGKRRGKDIDTEDKQADLCATVDYDDPRFSSLFTSHHFAIDPTDPQFSRVGSQLRAVAEKQQAKLNEFHAVDQTANPQGNSLPESQDLERKRKSELSSLVSSLKRKVSAENIKRVRAQ